MASKAKRSTRGAKKKLAPTRRNDDPCKPQRGRLAGLEKSIAETLEQLGSPDIGAVERQRLERKLEALQLRKPQMERFLKECIARHPPQRAKKKAPAKKRGVKKAKKR